VYFIHLLFSVKSMKTCRGSLCENIQFNSPSVTFNISFIIYHDKKTAQQCHNGNKICIKSYRIAKINFDNQFHVSVILISKIFNAKKAWEN